MFVRVVKGSSKKYVLIVRSFRDEEGKPRQRTVLNLGPVNEKNQKETVALAERMIANLEGGHVIIDGQEIQEIMRQNWGAPAIMQKLWDEFGLSKVISGSKEDVLKLMLTDRLISPKSKLSTFNNRNKYRGIRTDIDLNQLYRSLDYLAENSEKIKGHICKKQKLRSGCEIAFFDVTTLYFESQEADVLRDFGYSKDCKFNEVQVVLCLLVDRDGRPLSYELFSGNTFEGATLIPALERLSCNFEIKKLVIVADRGIGSAANLQAIKEAGYEYIVGAKLRSASKQLQQEAINLEGFLPLGASADESDMRKYKFIKNKDQNWVVLHSTKRARKDVYDRQRLIDRAQTMLDSGKIQNNKRGAKKFIKSESKTIGMDLEKIEYESQFDGYYALSFSDENLSAEKIAGAYHGLWQIEENFRILKSFFEVRPMFHWTKKRIEGHVLLNFLLLVMENYLLETCRILEPNLSHNSLRDHINQMQVSTLQIDSSRFEAYSQITKTQSLILETMKIPQQKNKKIT